MGNANEDSVMCNPMGPAVLLSPADARQIWNEYDEKCYIYALR